MDNDKDPPLVSIVIVNYKTPEMTADCIRSVIDQAGEYPYEIILVDNNSGDGSVDMLAGRFPEVEMLRLEENVGFARANNLAAKQASGKYILLLNSDTVVIDGAVDKLVGFAEEHSEAALWGGRTIFADGSLNSTSCWGRMTVWSIFCLVTGLRPAFPNSPLFSSETYGGWKRDSVRNVDIVTGCFLLIYRNLWEKLGGFGSNFFMYGEDADLCLRAAAAGAHPLITPEATIIHHGGKSEGVKLRKEIQLQKGKLTVLNSHMSGLRRVLAMFLMRLLPVSRGIAYRIGALLTRRESYAQRADLWRMVWSRRHEWWNGYEPLRDTELDPPSKGLISAENSLS